MISVCAVGRQDRRHGRIPRHARWSLGSQSDASRPGGGLSACIIHMPFMQPAPRSVRQWQQPTLRRQCAKCTRESGGTRQKAYTNFVAYRYERTDLRVQGYNGSGMLCCIGDPIRVLAEPLKVHLLEPRPTLITAIQTANWKSKRYGKLTTTLCIFSSRRPSS